jgi:citrate lyase subunit beta-like protein
VLPKVHSAEELETITDAMEAFGRAKGTIHFVATIESALALHNIGSIAAWRSVYGPEKGGQLKALLVTLLPSFPYLLLNIHRVLLQSLGQKTV